MAYEIVGGSLYDLDTGEVVGAVPTSLLRRMSRPQSASSSPLARFDPRLVQRMAAAAAGPALVPTRPSRIDETPLPVTATSVAAGATATISINSQIIFAPRRLIVPESIAPFFTIDAFSVGNVPLFAGNGSIPAEAFRPDSVNPNVRKITAQPGVPITVQVTNIDAVVHTFRGAIFGEGAQPSGC